MELNWYSLNDIVKETSIPYGSLARYIQRHSDFLNVRKDHKTYSVHTDSIPVLKKIRHLYQTGHNEKQVDKELSLLKMPVNVDYKDDNEKNMEILSLNETLKAMNESFYSNKMEIKSLHENIEKMHDNIDSLKEFNQELVKQLSKQQEYIDNRLAKRDELLMQSIRLTQQQIAATKNKKWWKIWK
ncbi:DUF3967 domain-containing protein [Heyndrickxia ginsengihumi]|uniref:DUF3967 domain-containing protein n=1 Tax=Heyndrickxia ginsengihumi TaxID=363870 RepID=UPI000470A2D8|nr:DUF3967 domain-containing protein [Heyndrickxia ginsengihumi]